MSRAHPVHGAMAVLCCLLPGLALAKPEISIPRPVTSNVFPSDQPVAFNVDLSGFPAGDAEVKATIRNYFGQQVWSAAETQATPAGKKTSVTLNVGKPGPGYYTLTVTAASKAGNASVTQHANFGIAPFVNRTAQEVREGGYRFGLKKWGSAEVKGVNQWSTEDALITTRNLGLQWTRDIFSQDGPVGIAEIANRHQINIALKVERFPKELYDTERYGPLEEWEKKFGRGAWTLKTLPKKEPYQQWLKQKLAQIPADQNVFEIWNEAWDKMSAEDFATLCQWIVPVILEQRPNAIIGPNLRGDTSLYEWDARVIKAGGLKGMKMVALHPYASSEDRTWLRQYKQWLKEQTGQEMQIYVTEFGSHSTPQGPAKRSEEEQAQRVVRQALSLYAEDVVAFMPHWMGQSEQNPTYIEDWFGFFRFNRQPKPVLIAYAAAAHLIDGSRYVGDLWYGPNCDAMLFERKGVYTLVLFTRGDEKEVDVAPGVEKITLVDMVGGQKQQAVEGGKLHLKLSADAIYLVGVSPDLARQASKEIRADRWPAPPKPPRNSRVATRFRQPLQPDGKMEEWQSATQLALLNPKVNGDDASAMAYVAWDEQYLYVALDVRDNEMLNVQPRAKLYRQDSLELFVSTEPRDENPGFGPSDHQFFITPTSGEKQPIIGEVTQREAGIVQDIAGAKFFGGKAGKGWALETAIPWSAFPGFKPAEGAKLALEMRLNDADTSHERWKLDPLDGNVVHSDPTAWSYLVLGGADAVPARAELPAVTAAPAPAPAAATAPPKSPTKTSAAAPAPAPIKQGIVAEWQFNADKDLPGGAIVKLDAAATGASRDSRLMPKSTYHAGPTGIAAGWKPFLASGYLATGKGIGTASDNQHGLVIADSNPAPGGKENDNSEYRDFMGFSGLGAAPRGGTVYLVLQPASDWADGRQGLMGSGQGLGKSASSGALGLSVEQGQLFFRAGRGENPNQAGHTAPVADLNGDGDQGDYVFAEASLTQKWNPQKWYFIAASWQEGAAPVLYVRELGDTPAASPTGVAGNVTTAKDNVVAAIPAQTTGPRYDPLAIGALWMNHGVPRTVDGGDAKIAYARVDNAYASSGDMERVFQALGAQAN